MTTTATMSGIGLKRLQHLVLWVSDVERSVRFYREVLGVRPPDEGVARMYHSAWEVGEITDLVSAGCSMRSRGSGRASR